MMHPPPWFITQAYLSRIETVHLVDPSSGLNRI
jgi:hypothetical protein